MTQPSSFFYGADNMDASNKLPFFPAGFLGRLRVDACKGITRRNGDKMFIAEFTVLSTNLPDKVYLGGRYSWCQNMKERDTAYAACIGFLYACLGLDSNRDKTTIDTTVKPKQDMHLNNAVSDANPLGGAEVMLQTTLKKTKRDTDFTLHAFSPAEKQAA